MLFDKSSQSISDLSTAAFIAGFRRFVNRRGRCSNLYSDNATNFVGPRPNCLNYRPYTILIYLSTNLKNFLLKNISNFTPSHHDHHISVACENQFEIVKYKCALKIIWLHSKYEADNCIFFLSFSLSFPVRPSIFIL